MQYYYRGLTATNTTFLQEKSTLPREQLFYTEICNSHLIYLYKRTAEIIYGIKFE